MRRFAELYAALDGTTATNAKVAAIKAWLAGAPPGDAAWALFFLTGQRLKGTVRSAVWGDLVVALTGIPPWLLGECYDAVGDGAETFALLLDGVGREIAEPLSLEAWVTERLQPLAGLDAGEQVARIGAWVAELSTGERYLLVKLLTGALRVGVSHTLVVRAVAEHAGLDRQVVAHRLMGEWTPSAAAWAALVSHDAEDTDRSRPYPFMLAHPLDGEPDALGDPADWQAEWKWDGIRAQLVWRGGELFVWSRGEELVTERFPELHADAARLPDGTVLDGEILAWRDGVLPFAVLQKRIGRKDVGKKALAEAPVAMVVYDVLEAGGEDVRWEPLAARRARLEALLPLGNLLVSPTVDGAWSDRAALRQTSRERGVEGLMLKRRDAPYAGGRAKGPWWKWKIEPYTVDAVLIYAQGGSGRRASLFTDYTFALWRGDELVPVAKAYTGLDDAEIKELDAWIRRNTIERFGPVRSVTPTHVFELAFEHIARSKRHKSGVAVRFPRIARWRRDKTPEDADRLDALIDRLPEE